ncbi:hypothetical protein JXA88_18520 [Candidatus Fermentibacteria bacterium]|nr:hypothetical protein [Candidatus Fermentibacteria bacterium]
MNRSNPRDNSGHPDLADIEAARAGEASPDIEAHIRTCPECTAALAQLEVLAHRAGAIRAAPRSNAADADGAVLSAIDRRATEIRWGRQRRRALAHPVWAAAAAVVLIGLSVLVVSPVRERIGPRGEIASATDMDRDGSTDIVDAYLLAVALQGDKPAANSWDLTGDAAVDDADVRAVARMAVSVERSTT